MMQNEVLTNVDIMDDNEVLFTTESGKQYKMYHQQDCCERVWLIGDFNKVLKSLVGKKIERVDVKYYDGAEYASEYDDYSSTISEFTFIVNGNTEVVKWFGNSNGYYCEKAELEEVR